MALLKSLAGWAIVALYSLTKTESQVITSAPKCRCTAGPRRGGATKLTGACVL